ncbi:putative transposase [Candidatus Hakubella thermalkaliphila]|uniref:Putative transposase n=1 Tax=Candidatus Hakubella thermalkaliphila TaxID=2754717 RepID=A0A6V8PTT0_9ACTN|nr:RNA-guided endonuclease TnpB family protein [Candidatus Hakubella thermalkaliphila]GFP24885.1 putative transposase [Candidatus Hakubella thermalkaliphila]GFP35697.1 putative transposase [Candidatus Hakubella thermalkaliphila]GFP42146.1 putative transposase [Candidatus Hakubella thermalkaliphila]
MVKKAITHLKLDQANPGKLRKLDQLALEHQRVVQAYVDWLIERQIDQPNKYADIPEQHVPTPLSDRWQRCAWQQACGIVQSWYANGRETPPVLRNVCLQANANVVVIEPCHRPRFDFWLRISTLEAGRPVRVPITLYGRARETLTQFPNLCTGVTLNKRDGQWYATFVVERRGPKAWPSAVVGVDIGMVSIVSTSGGQRYGQISPELRKRLERAVEKHRRKQKLNACLKRKDMPTVDLGDNRTNAFSRNEIGRALNQMLDELLKGSAVALERLSVKDMRFKSRQMNRVLRASQLGYVRDKLKFKLDERGIRYRSVQPAYSSQQCSHCGFTFSLNRRSQAEFRCLWCGYEANADVNAAANLAERFGDEELNLLPFREVETVLAMRFMRRLPDARSASAGLDTRVNEVAYLHLGQSARLKHPWHSCL